MQGQALIAAARLMGLAGLPHSAATCAVPCAAVVGRGDGGASQWLFQTTRVGGYAAAGAAAAWSVGAGALWIAWPCALSQSALLVAALASTPVAGAAAMMAFAVASSPALWLGPWLLQRWRAKRLRRPNVRRVGGPSAAVWPVRAAGGFMALASIAALGHALWPRVAAGCGGLP